MIDLKTIERPPTAGDTRQQSAISAVPDGATPFGAVMSTVQWVDRGKGGGGPQLTADEMFEAPAHPAARRKSALSGDGRLEALRAQSRERVRREAETQPHDTNTIDHAEVDAVSPTPSLIAPATNATQQVALPSRQGRAASAPPVQIGVTNQPATLATSLESANQVAGAIESDAAPALSLTSRATPSTTSAGSAAADTGNIARQVGRVLVESRGTDALPPKSDASFGLAKPDGLLKDARANKSAAAATSSETAAHRASDSPDETPPTRFDDLIRSIRIRAGEKQTSARLQLQPPRLGYMEVDVRMEGDQVHINVRTETDEARRQVHEQAVQLKSALEAAGIDMQQLRVSVDPEWLRHREWSDHAWMHGRSQDQADADARHSGTLQLGQSTRGASSPGLERFDGSDFSDDDVSSVKWGLPRLDLRI